MHDKGKWMEVWHKEGYAERKDSHFQKVDEYLGFAPKRILDIGCGRAWESERFQNKYGSELYLLDGDFNDNPTGSIRDSKWNDDAKTFAYYNEIDTLRNDWDSRGLEYQWVNANDPEIDPNTKFDLIYSFLSCGFHYPVSTYRDLILAHSTPDTKIIMDLRGKKISYAEDYRIVDVIYSGPKHKTCEIRL